ncbi:B3 domain-containing transcription factor VRN1-like isoform X3 [Cannabis sativa]|nr:B3 domain-containing transcription factor VRN1-like isoform X3 [Cannabis sativa]
MKYCGSLSSQIILNLPCGSRWEVGLTKSSDGKVWLEKGWNKFAQHFSLSRGNLVVFRYEMREFNVIIFGITMVEIDYPSNPILVKKHVHIDGDDVSFEVLEKFSLHPKSRVKSPLPCSQPHKKMKQSPLGKVMEKGSSSIKVESGDTIDNTTTGLPTSKRYQKTLSVHRNISAVERANYFQSEYPFFTVIMKASYTTDRRNFHIPRWFAQTYIKKEECKASLWISDDKSWHVQYKVRLTSGSTAAEFINGWKAFVVENNLEVGSICKFELTNIVNDVSFRVSIVKPDDDAHNYLATKLASTSKQNVRYDASSTKKNDKANIFPQNIISEKEEKIVVKLSDKSRKLISEGNMGNLGTSKMLHLQKIPASK